MMDRVRWLRAPLAGLLAVILGAGAAWAQDEPTDRPLREKLREPRTKLGIHWDEGLYLVDHPKRFVMRASLRLDMDHYGIDDDAYVAAGGRVGNTPSEFGVRRARLTVAGTLGPHHHWKLSLEATDSTGALRDNFIDGELPKVLWGRRWPRVRLGNFMEPLSLEQNTASGRLTYMERAGPSQALGLGRSLGLMAYDTLGGGRHGYSAGVFLSPGANLGKLLEASQDDSFASEGYGLTGRYWWMPVRDCGCACRGLMLGVALSQRVGMSGVRLRTRPESHAFDHVIDTDFSTDAAGTALLDDAQQATLAGLSAAWVGGRWFAQAEGYGTYVRSNAGGDPLFWGGYVFAGCWLTGECRRLGDGLVQPSRLCRPRDPCKETGGMGGVEVAARFSTVDLNSANILGGTLNTFSLELNWHLQKQRRLMFNVVRADVNDGVADEPIYIFQVRLQLAL
jgi:phosphate-selective porin OprO/OprP